LSEVPDPINAGANSQSIAIMPITRRPRQYRT
jgi:hypothetical protein